MPQARRRREHRQVAVVRSRAVAGSDGQREAIRAAVSELIRGEPGADFDETALAVFAYQYERIPAYRRFCDARDRGPAAVDRPDRIPAIPSDVFKHRLLPQPDDGRGRVFLSSGTTGGDELRSRHFVECIETYRASALTHFERMVMPDAPGPMSVAILGPTESTHPDSSLGCMFTWCAQRHGDGPALQAFDAGGRMDLGALLVWLEDRAAGTAPVLLLGVSSAFAELFSELRKKGVQFRLPADSRLVDTGGSKGGTPVLSAKGLLKAAWKSLHIPAYLCVNEYGMTEMLSQFYDDALRSRFAGDLGDRAKVGPPWVRTAVVDPATLEPVAPGDRGLLRHLDLANWASISALQTLDAGRTRGRGFELLGRAEGAEARGCSALLSEVRSVSESDA
jgi:hypothetical protein